MHAKNACTFEIIEEESSFLNICASGAGEPNWAFAVMLQQILSTADAATHDGVGYEAHSQTFRFHSEYRQRIGASEKSLAEFFNL